jgi:hypothetical protein
MIDTIQPRWAFAAEGGPPAFRDWGVPLRGSLVPPPARSPGRGGRSLRRTDPLRCAPQRTGAHDSAGRGAGGQRSPPPGPHPWCSTAHRSAPECKDGGRGAAVSPSRPPSLVQHSAPERTRVQRWREGGSGLGGGRGCPPPGPSPWCGRAHHSVGQRREGGRAIWGHEWAKQRRGGQGLLPKVWLPNPIPEKCGFFSADVFGRAGNWD